VKGECVAAETTPQAEAPLSQTDKVRGNQAIIDKNPMYNFLGIRVDEVGNDGAKLSIERTPQVMTPPLDGGGQAHVNGGVISLMAGAAAGMAAYEAGDPSTTFIRAQDSHTTYLAQPRSFPVTAEARLVHRSKHMIVTDVVVTDGGGYPVERMSTTWAVVPLPNQGASPA
jgi:uncharacterized protein (TIGR00369 family)